MIFCLSEASLKLSCPDYLSGLRTFFVKEASNENCEAMSAGSMDRPAGQNQLIDRYLKISRIAQRKVLFLIASLVLILFPNFV
jgi:hypothetical protein